MNYNNLQYLKPVMQKEINSGSIHGCAIRIIHNNQVIHEEELGYADKENAVPIKKDTIYRMYSMTKPITAAAVMILYERGMIDLFDPVSDYLQGFHNQKVWTKEGLVDVKKPVTIWNLLTMTSGLIYPDQRSHVGHLMDELYSEAEKQWKQGNPFNTLELCNRIGELPLTFQPGEKYCYGTSADILGGIIEVASGKKLSQFLQEEVFSPLGMVDTGFNVPNDKLSRLAVLYEYKEQEKQLQPCEWSRLGYGTTSPAPDFELGGGGLVSTMQDYSRFAMMLSNGGIYDNVRILGTKTVRFMTQPQLSTDLIAYYDNDNAAKSNYSHGSRGYNYGILMRNLIDPAKAGSNGSIGEFGWDGWSGNHFFVDPKENLILLYMIQKADGCNASVIRKLRAITYSIL